MGKRIIARRRGRGTNVYRLPSVGERFKTSYRNEKGKITDIVHDVGRDSPVAKVSYPDGSSEYVIAYKGLKVGDETSNIGLPLGKIPESTQVFGLETYPNSGPKLCMAPGSFATLVSKTEKECIVQLPSKKTKSLNPNCRASIGIPAGDGRSEKPWGKVGNKLRAMQARGGRNYPRASPVCMNAMNHPYGGSTGPGQSKSISRSAPPGAKVGSIAARRTGRKR